jgi:predicted ferric reductase
VTWYLARASGITLYLLLWLATVLGLGLTTKTLDRFGGRGMIHGLHDFATQLSYGFLALHLLSLAVDETVAFGARALLIPFASTWREPWTGLGVLAAWLTVLIGVSAGLRRLTGFRAWRVLHWLTFPLYLMALLHAVGAGSDRSAPWAQAFYLLTAAAVLCLTLYRVLRGRARAVRSIGTRAAPLDRMAPAAADHQS